MKKLKIGSIAFDQHGRIALNDADLEQLEADFTLDTAAGAGSNDNCTNPWCDGTSNAVCNNVYSCTGSSNYSACIGHVNK
jgi:hypothetical protein